MKRMVVTVATGLAMVATYANAQTTSVIELWKQGKPAFGVYAPNENPGPRGQGPRPAVYTRDGGEKLAANPLYDYVFLNLEGASDASAIKAMADGL